MSESKIIDTFDEKTFKDLTTKNAAVVMFYASYCPPCQKYLKKLQELSISYSKIKFIKFDVEDESLDGILNNLKTPVKSVPTFYFLKKEDKSIDDATILVVGDEETIESNTKALML